MDKLRPIRRIDYAVLRQEIRSGDEVLDYGCGRMPYIDLILKQGATYSSAEINGAGAIDYSINEFGKINNCTRQFDVIMLMDVLQHTKNTRDILNVIRTHLKPEGRLIVTTPFIFPECDFQDFHRWTRSGIRQLLYDAGFDIRLQVERGGFFLCIGYTLLSNFSNLVIGNRSGWRIRISNQRKLLLLAIEILILPILWISYFVDTIFTNKYTYLGTVTVCSLRELD